MKVSGQRVEVIFGVLYEAWKYARYEGHWHILSDYHICYHFRSV